jgi:hypothetical protein
MLDCILNFYKVGRPRVRLPIAQYGNNIEHLKTPYIKHWHVIQWLLIIIIMMMMMMSMGSEHVSELRQRTGLLSTPQVIYEHGNPRWNDVDWGNFPTRPREHSLTVLSAEPSGSKSEGCGWSKWWILSTKYIFHTPRVLLHAVKSYDVFTDPPKKGVLRLLISFKY